jgi:glycosyltransferase involved in cell wall biosynthesis
LNAAEKPKVLIYSDCPVFGGADWVVAHVVNDEELGSRFDFSLVYRAHDLFEKGLRRALKRPVRAVPVRFPDRVTFVESVDGRWPKAAMLALKIAMRALDMLLFPYEVLELYRVMRAERPSVVHVNNGGYPGALGSRAAAVAGRLSGVPTLMVCHNLARPRRVWQPVEAVIDAAVSRSCKAFATCSVAASRELEKRGLSKRVGQLPNGVPEPSVARPRSEVRAELACGETDLLVAMTAFFERRKGHHVLVEAAKALSSRDALAGVVFVFLGDGPQRPAIEKAVAAAGLGDRFRFLGYRSDVAEIVAACDLVALPSVAGEDMPLAVLEAMAQSKPVVASALAGIVEEIEDGRTGALVPPGDAAALAAALERLLRDAPLRLAQGAAGRERYLERFTSSHVAARYGECYAQLLAA